MSVLIARLARAFAETKLAFLIALASKGLQAAAKKEANPLLIAPTVE